MAEENVSLNQGVSFMEKCLEAALNEQRGIAHGAIDMDDWGKAQEILAIAKKNISTVEDLRAKFNEFKNAVLAVDLTSELNAAMGGVPIAPAKNDNGAKEPSDEPEPAAAKPEGPQGSEGSPLVNACEELIEKYPFVMALAYNAPEVGEKFTSDDVIAKSDMKNPVQLSNGLWVDTAISEDDARKIVDGICAYCEKSKQG